MENNNAGKQVSVITVTYNSEAVIGKCLNSIPKDVAKVVVVDNASCDDTCTAAQNARADVEVICCEKNLGFGRANNLALREVKTEFALLLNPDTVIKGDAVERLLQAAQRHPDAAIVAPLLYNEDGSLQDSFKESVFIREKQKKVPCVEPEEDVFPGYISGAVMLLRMKCFEELGFFDEQIFLFYEDDDLCLRASAAGYELVVTPKAKVMHLKGQSSPASRKVIYIKNWHMMWSRLYLEKKYHGARLSRVKAVQLFYLYAFKAAGYSAGLNSIKLTKCWAKARAALAFLFGKAAV